MDRNDTEVDNDRRVTSVDGPRPALIDQALRLSYLSVGWGALSGVLSVGIGLSRHSLSVVGVGLNVLADMAGSVMLIRRFRAEQQDPARTRDAERRAAIVIAAMLILVALVLAVSGLAALLSASRPESSPIAMAAAAVNVGILLPLGVAKRAVGGRLGSAALQGDGALSLVGAIMAFFALLGLVVDRAFGWWWADRVAALVVAVIVAAEAARIIKGLGKRV
jgi:divalent metal cation (Fe/Co/Zn/Cd) transporter